MMDLLIFGSFWFDILLCVASVLIIIAAETASPFYASATILGTVGLLFFLGNKVEMTNLFSYAMNHPVYLIGAVLSYFLIGTVWSVVKWYFFLIKKRDQYKEEKETISKPLEVQNYKSDIMSWMIYWPFSALWTIFDSPVKKAFSLIFGKIKGGMQRMSDKILEPVVDKDKYSNSRNSNERF